MQTNRSVYNVAKMLIKLKRNFQVSYSNYTMMIEKENGDKIKGAASMKSKRFFAAMAKLKKRAKECPDILKGMKEHRIQKHHTSYFNSLFFKQPLFFENIYAVDITNAYPTVLRNEGFINDEIWQYLQKIDKKDRLAAIGSLASKKETNIFEEGRIIASDQTEAETAFIFKYAVNTVDYLINKAVDLSEDETFLFYWFDCLYFTEKPNNLHLIEGLFKANDLELHTKEIKNFYMNKDERNILIQFEERNKKGKFENKVFFLPQTLRPKEFKYLKPKTI